MGRPGHGRVNRIATLVAGPGWSTRRLEIRHAAGGTCVSPADEEGFLAALQARCGQLTVTDLRDPRRWTPERQIGVALAVIFGVPITILFLVVWGFGIRASITDEGLEVRAAGARQTVRHDEMRDVTLQEPEQTRALYHALHTRLARR